jgi:cell division control protein 6
MQSLSLVEKLVLLAVMVETEFGHRPSHTGKVYRRYAELSKLSNIEPVTSRRFYDVLRSLADEGILWVRTQSFGRYGRTTLIKLLAPPASLCQEITEDLLVGELAEGICRG